MWNPEGKLLDFVCDGTRLGAYDPTAKRTRVIAQSQFPRPPCGSNRFYAWSTDSRGLAYTSTGERAFRNVFVSPAAGGQVSFLSNRNAGTVLWGDGTLSPLSTPTSARRKQHWADRSDPRAPHFREDCFRDLFKETPAPAGGRGSTPPEKCSRSRSSSMEPATV
jgi:hypothetical protein